MHSPGVAGKLTAILSADVQGCGRLRGTDEAATVRTLTTYQYLVATFIRQHRGRVVDCTRDNLPVEFASVVEAVRSAVAVQGGVQSLGLGTPDCSPQDGVSHQHERTRYRLPAMHDGRGYVEAGAVMAFGVDSAACSAAPPHPKILKGAKSADLPVEKPMPFELVITLKTAKALGLTFPQSILIRADQVIQ